MKDSRNRRVHVLTAGFTSPNSCAFLAPLLRHRTALAEAGLDVRIFKTINDALTDCDVLIIEGRYYSPRWQNDEAAILEEIVSLRRKVGNLIFVDVLDSAMWDHAKPLPYVTLYCKSQIWKERSAYLKPVYGHRIFSHFYHHENGISDRQLSFSRPAESPDLLDKLAVGWNSALADYTWLGPYLTPLRDRFPFFLHQPSTSDFAAPDKNRPIDVTCRIGITYDRATVAFQRQRTADILRHRVATGKLKRRAYLGELTRSKIAVSPFGLGEITLRDFEIFMAGALLLKPDMSGVETWPDLYTDGETMLAYRWDLSNLEEVLDRALARYDDHVELARAGQKRYREALIGEIAANNFAEHLRGLIAKSEAIKNDAAHLIFS
jgi:hypothetical protein